MPHLFFSGASDEKPSQSPPENDTSSDKENVWGRTWKQMGNWLKQDGENEPPPTMADMDGKQELSEKVPCHDAVPTRPSHAIIPGMPRPITFKRQDSERRERLYPHEPDHEERRATSADRRLGISYDRKLSSCPLPPLASSPPTLTVLDLTTSSDSARQTQHNDFASTAGTVDGQHSDRPDQDLDTHSQYDWSHPDVLHHSEQLSDALDDLQIQSELEAKWILNLSMHFRDHSDREKFFVTYAEEPNKWRRVTVSCDYRHAPDDSLEADLKSLHYQRDKSARVYEAIRDSLLQIQFYQTVTNLRLETSGGRLHVHVTEDVNEIIQYPSVSSVAHLDLPEYLERTIEFDCHMSGFVYKVKTSTGDTFIKKEIPGPEAVEEFIYEINALSSLRGVANVVQLEGIVVDERRYIKGILLNYCEQGALVDVIYDLRDTDLLTWPRRLRWARQIVQGLAEIHEAGFVQGDFTLSNIVICHKDNAHIIDINRRGCPIGWEPPELSRLIQTGHRISMYIGVKSDIFQLGMVLWGLAEQQDEPERQERPLRWRQGEEDVPKWYRDIVDVCLSPTPKDRLLAKELLVKFPLLDEEEARQNGIQAPTIAVDDVEAAGKVTDRSDVVLGHAPQNLSPVYGSSPANIDLGVEYLVTSQGPDKRADSAADSYGQPDLEQLDVTTSDPTREHTRSLDKVPAESDVPCPSQQIQPCGLIRELHLAALAEEAGATANDTFAHPQVAPNITYTSDDPLPTTRRAHMDLTQVPSSGTYSTEANSGLDSGARSILSTMEQMNMAPAPTVTEPAPVSLGLLSATTSIASEPIASPTLSLGNPPLATISPPPPQAGILTPSKNSSESIQTVVPEACPLPVSSPTEFMSGVVPMKIPGHRISPSVELGSPALATLSPPSNSVDLRTNIVPINTPTHYTNPSADLGSPPLATLSPLPPTSTMSILEGDSVAGDLSPFINLGNPPLASISPPPALAATHETSSVLPTEQKAERTNTLGLEMAKHHDSGFDEPSSSTSGTPVSPSRVPVIAEEQPGIGQSTQKTGHSLESG